MNICPRDLLSFSRYSADGVGSNNLDLSFHLVLFRLIAVPAIFVKLSVRDVATFTRDAVHARHLPRQIFHAPPDMRAGSHEVVELMV